ncbi:MAG: carbohydrate ABC transporter permease [Chloroflexota bacterium]
MVDVTAQPDNTKANVQKQKRTAAASAKPLPIGQWAVYAVLLIGVVFSLLPFLWMVSWSVMTRPEVVVGRVVPASIQYENYIEAWQVAEFSNLMWNSVRITGISIAGLLLFCIPAAYAFARMKFWGRDVLFAITLATLMIPDIVTLIPNFLTVVWIHRFSVEFFGDWAGWLNNWPSLTVPFWASAFTIFLLRQFFAQIPDDLWDAARMDGASHVQFLLRIVLPLSKAPVMTVSTFAFIGSWNSLLWPLLVINGDAWKPIALGLTNFVQNAGDEFHLQMAAAVIMIIPILIVYFFTQKQFTEGIYSGSFKG